MNRVNVVWVAAATIAVAACTDFDSETSLNAEGPPMIQQVFMKEIYTAPGAANSIEREVFGFGTHPMATTAQNACEGKDPNGPCVTSAVVSGQSLRIIVDELLRGNNLEEINCRATVDDDAYQRVPLGATPDDIAKCSAPQDVLPRSCVGDFRVCICELDAGCAVGSTMIAKGEPVGVTDINQDGAVDDTRLIAGAMRVQCGSIDVPVDPDNSYWNPSGNQLVPAQGGFRALGPALVLVPLQGLPTNIDCQLAFAEDVVDKQGERICAPLGGDMTASCTPGDVSAFKFRTEPMEFLAVPEDGSTGVSRTAPATLLGNTNVDPASITNIVITDLSTMTNLVQGTNYMLSVMMGKNIQITWLGGGLQANRMYRITVPTTVRDSFGQGLPQPLVITFTTGA